eukprot:865123-Amorphochlora_amoeboformis.AAC.2
MRAVPRKRMQETALRRMSGDVLRDGVLTSTCQSRETRVGVGETRVRVGETRVSNAGRRRPRWWGIFGRGLHDRDP